VELSAAERRTLIMEAAAVLAVRTEMGLQEERVPMRAAEAATAVGATVVERQVRDRRRTLEVSAVTTLLALAAVLGVSFRRRTEALDRTAAAAAVVVAS
jgi:hypothetical protein